MSIELDLAAPSTSVGAYRLDPVRSTVTYAGRHMFGLGVVHATFSITSGEMRIAEPPAESTVVVVIDAASFASGNAKRDKDVCSAGLLDTATFRDITFASDSLRCDGGQWVLSGTVTAHGTAVSTDVTFDRMTRESGALHVKARAAHLDRYAFGVTGSKGMVGRHFDLELDVYVIPI